MTKDDHDMRLFEDLGTATMEEIRKINDNMNEIDDQMVAPDPTSPEWNDYVMGHFEDDELIDGRPLAAGLRRVAELIMGPIVESGPTQVFPPQNDREPGRATVVWKIRFENGNTFSDAADCWIGNTDDKYVAFSVATAATRSEARALRKALKIRSVAAEELTEKDTADIVRSTVTPKDTTKGDYDDSKRMTDKQSNFINVKCKQCDIDVIKLFKNELGISANGMVMVKQASSMIDKLNYYQQNPGDVPSKILGYNSDWRQ
jgi:hypothetical protein